jgi:hypothetical protein
MAREGFRRLNDVRYEKNRPWTTKFEWSGSNPIYIGKAQPGTGMDEPYWQIKKLTWSGSTVTDIQFADKVSTFTKTWNDRATYTYG